MFVCVCVCVLFCIVGGSRCPRRERLYGKKTCKTIHSIQPIMIFYADDVVSFHCSSQVFQLTAVPTQKKNGDIICHYTRVKPTEFVIHRRPGELLYRGWWLLLCHVRYEHSITSHQNINAPHLLGMSTQKLWIVPSCGCILLHNVCYAKQPLETTNFLLELLMSKETKLFSPKKYTL